MHSAPSVSYPVGRSRFLMGLLLAVGLLALSGVAAVVMFMPAWARVWALAGWVGWGGVAVVAWRRQPQGWLQWMPDSQVSSVAPCPGRWMWRSVAYQDGVSLRCIERVQDWQTCMLLRLRNPDGARLWVWVEQRGDPACWDDLRRAVVAHS